MWNVLSDNLCLVTYFCFCLFFCFTLNLICSHLNVCIIVCIFLHPELSLTFKLELAMPKSIVRASNYPLEKPFIRHDFVYIIIFFLFLRKPMALSHLHVGTSCRVSPESWEVCAVAKAAITESRQPDPKHRETGEPPHCSKIVLTPTQNDSTAGSMV